jgi:hypothetical protein
MLIIEELECGRDVFDITVEDNHNFYANGVLVHNCEIMLPTESFERVDDAGELVIAYQGKELRISNLASARLASGEIKLVRFISVEDEVEAFLFEDGRELVLLDE